MSRQTFYTYRRRLPHWRLKGAAYFVTWRRNRSQLDLTPAERSTIVAALRYSDGERYNLDGYVVMNDHVHVLVSPRPRCVAVLRPFLEILHRILTSASRPASWQNLAG